MDAAEAGPIESVVGLWRGALFSDRWPKSMVLGRMGIREITQMRHAARVTAVASACIVLANCADSDKFTNRVDPKYGVSSSARVVDFSEPSAVYDNVKQVCPLPTYNIEKDI